jgi:hypothetical protein
MIKLSDTNYRLPTIEALRPSKLFDKGTTAPLGVVGVDTETGEKGDYVVKLKNSDRMTMASSAFELIGAWMAMELEIPTVEPALVNVSQEFVEVAMIGQPGYRAALQSQGINFGSRYVSGLLNMLPDSISFSNGMLDMAKLIYVLDLFIANTDRGHQRPNVAISGSQLIIYDYELAFSFIRILQFFRNKTPWLLNEADRDLYEKHFFYKVLRESQHDFTPEVSKLQCFDSNFWEKLYLTLPNEWKDEQVLEIGPYLMSIVENHSYFTESLNKTVAI